MATSIPRSASSILHSGTAKDDPLELYLAGEFDDWQQWQTKRNFQRDLVVSLISLPRTRNLHWLFGGVFSVHGCVRNNSYNLFRYDLRRRSEFDELDGRLVVSFKRPGRQSYLKCERWMEDLKVAEIRPEKLRISEFKGYSWAMLTKQELDIVMKQQVESWKTALGAVSGVYVIADRKTGKLYVGSATSGEGIWSRWCQYAENGHGGNRDLRELLKKEGAEYSDNFHFGDLEIADTHASTQDVLDREGYWKDLLLTRKHGYNAN
jgi:hypothetical protein